MPKSQFRVFALFFLIFVISFSILSAKFNFTFDPLNAKSSICSPEPNYDSCINAFCTKKILYLNDILNLALCRNPDTRTAWINVLGSAATLGSSLAAYLPTITETASINKSYIKIDSHNSQQTFFDNNISLNYLLYDFGGREAAVDVSKQALFSLDFTYNSTFQNTLFSTVKAYYSYIASKASVVAAEESLKSSKATMDAATMKLKVGTAALVDKLQAETAFFQAKLVLTQAQNQVQINRGAIFNLIGIDPDTHFDIGDNKLSTDAPADEFSLNTSELIETAKKMRPDLAAAEYQVYSAGAAIEVARAKNYPSISFSASNVYDNFFQNTGKNGIHYQSTTLFGVSISLPIFTGFFNTYQIIAAKENYYATLEARNKAEYNVVFDIWQSYQNLQTAKENLTTTEKIMKSATEADLAALDKYKQGAGSILDLLTADTQLANARQQRILAQYTWIIDRNDLIRALGLLTLQKLERINSL